MTLRLFGHVCLTIICAAIVATAGTLAWFAADRTMPVHVLSSEVLTPRVRPGEKLVIRQRVQYVRDCSAHIDRALYDGETHREFLRDVDYDHPPLGIGTRIITFEEDVPGNFMPGSGEYRALPSYACNPLQKFYWPITRAETILTFTIVTDALVVRP